MTPHRQSTKLKIPSGRRKTENSLSLSRERGKSRVRYRITWNHKIDQVVFAVHPIAPLIFTFFSRTYWIFPIHFPTHMHLFMMKIYQFLNKPQNRHVFFCFIEKQFSKLPRFPLTTVFQRENYWVYYEVTLVMCLFVTKIAAIHFPLRRRNFSLS